MKRTPAQAGPFAAWLKRKREDRYNRQRDAIEDMRRLAGISISASEFAQWESGSRIPREDNPKRLRLIEFFGGWNDEPVQEAGDGQPQVIPGLSTLFDKLDRQAEVIDRLVSGWAEDRALIRQLLARLAPEDFEAVEDAAIEGARASLRRQRSGQLPTGERPSTSPPATEPAGDALSDRPRP